MIDTTRERWADGEAECVAAGDDPIKLLCALVRMSGQRITFDLGADAMKACTCCGTMSSPCELVRIGAYPNGDAIRRPACLRCRVTLYLRGCEPKDRQLQVLAAYEVARGGDRRRASTREELEAAIADRTSGRPQGLTAGWPEGKS